MKDCLKKAKFMEIDCDEIIVPFAVPQGCWLVQNLHFVIIFARVVQIAIVAIGFYMWYCRWQVAISALRFSVFTSVQLGFSSFLRVFFYLECAEIYNLFFICGQVLRERRKITLVTEFKSFFSEILAALNLRGSPVRLTEVELRCEVYYVASFKLIWTFVAFTVRGKTTNWLHTSLGRWYYF